MRRVASSLLMALLGTGAASWISSAGSQDRPAPPGEIYFIEGIRLARIQPDGRERSDFPRELARIGLFQPHSARIAPDGRTLAFGRGELRGGGIHPPSGIRVMDVTKARGEQSLADLPGTEVHHWAWSRDGRKLAFASWDAENHTRNWVVDVRSKKAEEVKLPLVKEKAGKSRMRVEDWSPDGKSFLAAGGGVHVVRADGSGGKRLTPADLQVHGGTCRFSPDGRKILFVATKDGKHETLYVADLVGGKPRPVVEFLNFTRLQACWSPDGRRIAYSFTFLNAKGDPGKESNLNVVDSDGKNTRTIVSASHGVDEVKLLLVGWQ
jgi:Tol biopolymer transport system component